MTPLGLQVYLWSEDDQNRFLRQWLGQAVRALHGREALHGFWFNRFDARGPHVIAVMDVEEIEREALEESLGAYLEDHPSTAELSHEELEARHAGCRGKALSPIDRDPGMAANNTFASFLQGPDALPYNLGTHLCESQRHGLGAGLRDAALWAIDCLTGDPMAASLAWIAAVDQVLGQRFGPAATAAQWRYHATTLLLGLEERLAATPEEEIVAGLPRMVGAANMSAFDAAWEGLAERLEVPDLTSILELLAVSRPEEEPRAVRYRVRELSHFTLKQLGLRVSLHAPLVFYAWARRAREAG